MYINASLIREIRMAYQHLFGRSPGMATSYSTLKCSFCLRNEKKKPQDAITVRNGNALCATHI